MNGIADDFNDSHEVNRSNLPVIGNTIHEMILDLSGYI